MDTALLATDVISSLVEQFDAFRANVNVMDDVTLIAIVASQTLGRSLS